MSHSLGKSDFGLVNGGCIGLLHIRLMKVNTCIFLVKYFVKW